MQTKIDAFIHWQANELENNIPKSALWRCENGAPPPKKVVLIDDKITADKAYSLACGGTGLLWTGDFQNARQLLQAMGRRSERNKKKKSKPESNPESNKDAFNLHRQAQAQRARTLSMLLIPLNEKYEVPLNRAPNVTEACSEVYGKIENTTPSSVVSLRELQGLIGAHEWRKKGVIISALSEKSETRIHPHYGVFSPVRGEYLNLIKEAPLPSNNLAFDIGTGTGVISAILAQREVKKIIATDQDPRALSCASENLNRLGYNQIVEVIQKNMFPEGRAPLIVCNPPWIPARPSAAIEYAIYDPNSQMLKAFLSGLASHLEPQGEGWLIISDIAEHLGLRTRVELLTLIKESGLKIIGKLDTKPTHPKALDEEDPLYAARAKEVTSLWRLGIKD